LSKGKNLLYWYLCPAAGRGFDRSLLLVASAVAFAFILPTGESDAKPPSSKEFDRHFEQGAAHFAAGRYEAAEQSFRTAQTARPSSPLIVNIGKCQEKQGKYVDALESYRAFLEQEPSAPNKGDVEATIQYLEEKISLTMARLEITSTPPGATVHLDGSIQPAGITPLSRWLPFGTRRLRLALEGHLPLVQELTLTRDGPQRLELKLVAENAPGRIELANVLDGAQVVLDGQDVGQTPLPGGLEVAPGEHQIGLSKEGHLPFVAGIQVGPGAVIRVEAVLPPQGAGAPPPPAAAGSQGAMPRVGFSPDSRLTQEGPDQPFVPLASWIAAGTAVAALATGVVFYALAQGEIDEAQQLGTTPGADRELWQQHRDDAARHLLVANAGFGLAAAAALAGGGWFAWQRITAADSAPGDESPMKTISFLPAGRTCSLSFRF